MSSLKDCPCCNGKASFVKTYGLYEKPMGVSVICNECGLRTDLVSKKKDAAKIWNHRHKD